MPENILKYIQTDKFKPISLSFYDKNVEQQFEQDYFVSSKVSLRFGIMYSFVFLMCHWFLNAIKFHTQSQSVDLVFVLVFYIGITIMFLSYKNWFGKYSQLATSIYGVSIFGWLCSTFNYNQNYSLSQALLSFIPSVFLLIIVFYSFMRLRFTYSAILLTVISVVFVLFLDKFSIIANSPVNSAIIATYLFLINLFGMLLSHRLEYYSRRQFLLTKSLSIENQRSEDLILNILPESIANRLKESDDTIVDEYSDVSILFSDICGFTPLSAKIPAKQVVVMLNEMFTKFDEIAEKYSVEKIKTMGDCYMAVAGMPIPNKDHANLIASMAINMKEFVRTFNDDLDVRIGINSGPVVAGVIGTKKFIYDLWGDAVNVAARMESHSTKGEIQITEDTYNLIKDKFECEYRGVINVKGKGDMNTYFLKGAIQ